MTNPMATALVTQAGIKKRFFMFYFSSLSFSFFLNTGSDCQTDQHTQGDADAGIVPKGSADGCAKTHSHAHTLCAIIVALFFFLFLSDKAYSSTLFHALMVHGAGNHLLNQS